MIDTTTIPNWTTWDEKTTTGVNRGDTQAYRNTNRADYAVRISTRTYESLGKSHVAVTTHTPDGNETQSFNGTDDVSGYVEQSETIARQFMEANPCDRAGDRETIEVLTDLMNALRDGGCPPQHDADIRGWTTSHGSVGFALRPESHTSTDANNTVNNPQNADEYIVNLNIDGKASGVSYREYTERQNDDTIRLHEPTNPSCVTADIQTALETAGFTVQNRTDIRKTAHQTHWDHSLSYEATVQLPTDLQIPATISQNTTPLFG